jgi:hypothetical protein
VIKKFKIFQDFCSKYFKKSQNKHLISNHPKEWVWLVLSRLHPMVIYIKDHKTTMMKNHITSKDANVCSLWNIVNAIILTKEVGQKKL